MKFRKDMLLLYGITDQRWADGQTLYEQVEAALQGGATMIQLREKQLDEEAFLQEAKVIRDLCDAYRVPLIINDRVSVAFQCGAAGVHVGAEDLAVAEIRRMAPKDFIIGATAKTVEQAMYAQKSGADYIGVGAVFPSATKTNARRITLSGLREICSAVDIPAVAIGGIGLDNVLRLKGCGMSGIAVVSEIFSADDICAVTRALKEMALQVTEQNADS